MINIILYQCEKPSNLGNIIRTCAATGVRLHVIGPLTFQLDDNALKRAGMDYLTMSDFDYYPDYQSFIDRHGEKQIHCITRYGHRPPSMVDFSKVYEDYYIIFGKESTGLPKEILKIHYDRCLRLPMVPAARSLNLANCVAILIYEVLRQQDYFGLASDEQLKGIDWLDEIIKD